MLEPFNPFRPQVVADPYPYYRLYREEEPVHFSQTLDAWVLTRYRDVEAVLNDGRFSANRRLARNRFAQMMVQQEMQRMGPVGQVVTMLGADPPDHTRLRRLVSKAFTARAVESLRPRIQSLVDGLLDTAEQKGDFDLIADLAFPLPVIVIAEMLGVPPEDRDTFKRWSDDVAASLGLLTPPDVAERARRSIIEMTEYFSQAVAERRRRPREDLISGLVAAEEQGQALSEQEVLATLVLLLVAGNETTTNLIGNGMLALFRHPDQWERLCRQPELVRTAVEELLRYESPAQATSRVALEEIEIDGHRIEPYQLVFCILGSANRDPEIFAEPDRLDIAREPNPHLAFGDGIHFCLGAPLARAEAQAAFSALARRFPHIRPREGAPEWAPNYILRGLKRLPVSVR
jgi:cytochrome P450